MMWGWGYALVYREEFKQPKKEEKEGNPEIQSILEDNKMIVAVTQKTKETLSESVIVIPSDEEPEAESAIPETDLPESASTEVHVEETESGFLPSLTSDHELVVLPSHV